MRIGILQVEIIIHESGSLKQKRFILNRLKDKIRKKFNVSVIEAAYREKWQRSVLAFAAISTNARVINSGFCRILDMIEKSKDGFEILRDEIEII